MREFEAYYDKKGAWPFLALALVFLTSAVCSPLFLPDEPLAFFIVIGWIIAAVWMFCLFWSVRSKQGVAVEVCDGNLRLYKRKVITVPLSKIWKVMLCEDPGAFAFRAETKTGEYRMDCCVHDCQEKKAQFAELLKAKNIRVETYTEVSD